MADLQIGSVLVTGSNRGIGLELVKKFLESPIPPDWVFATCRDPEGPKSQELKALASEHSNLVVLQLDVTDHSSILEAAKKVESKLDGSGLNLVINNAAMMHRTMLHDSTREDLMESYDNNVIGPLLVSQVFLPLLKKAAQGNPAAALSCNKAAVINISAVLGSIELVPELLDFCPVIPYRLSKNAATERFFPPPTGTSAIVSASFLLPLGKQINILYTGYNTCLQQLPNPGTSFFMTEQDQFIMFELFFHMEQFGDQMDTRETVSLFEAVCKKDSVFIRVLTQVALNMLTRCQAETYRKDGILSVAIHPGWVQTDMGSMAAPLTKDASVRGMLRVLASLSEKNTGTMMDWEGNTLPW